MTALIIGLGLIGGSIAKTLKKNSDWIVLGYDINDSVVSDAVSCGAVDAAWNLGEKSSPDITVLCMSPTSTVEFLKSNAKYLLKGSVVTDVCGIKQRITKECSEICREYGLLFIGGHPMAGKERSGFKNSDQNLFNRASYILTPTEETDPKAIEVAKDYVAALKVAKITVTTPKNHDKMIAFTSQLPHVIAGAYVKSPSCLERRGFSAGSFKDVSRVATVDENLWSELFLQNRDMLIPEIECLIEKLSEYKGALVNNDANTLKDIIRLGRTIKENDLKEMDKD